MRKILICSAFFFTLLLLVVSVQGIDSSEDKTCLKNKDCDDNNPCTIDFCSGKDICRHENVIGGTRCGENMKCFGGECQDAVLASNVKSLQPTKIINLFPTLQEQNNILFFMMAVLIVVVVGTVLYSLARAYG